MRVIPDWVARMRRAGDLTDWMVGEPAPDDMPSNQRWNQAYQAARQFDMRGDEWCELLEGSCAPTVERREGRRGEG